jgi:8-oxo-dGTP pyrophosphatase MutT (NUDIX family)
VNDSIELAALVEQWPYDAKSRELVLMLLQHTPSPYRREQFTPGHITATACVLHPQGGRFLLVHHKRLDRWLFPGGHVEDADSAIWDTARREAVEETGVLLSPQTPWLAGIDVHGIPGKKREPYHLHHDLIFCFRAIADALVVSEETRAVAWCSPAEFDKYELPASIRECVTRALDRSS